jgi:hypothetical protein
MRRCIGMEVNTIDLTMDFESLQDIEIKHYPSMPEKYSFRIGQLSIWFKSKDELELFIMSSVVEFNKVSEKKLIMAGII